MATVGPHGVDLFYVLLSHKNTLLSVMKNLYQNPTLPSQGEDAVTHLHGLHGTVVICNISG